MPGNIKNLSFKALSGERWYNKKHTAPFRKHTVTPLVQLSHYYTHETHSAENTQQIGTFKLRRVNLQLDHKISIPTDIQFHPQIYYVRFSSSQVYNFKLSKKLKE